MMREKLRGTPWYGPLKIAQNSLPAQRELRARRRTLYREFVDRRSLCFDIGANMGNRTEIFLALGARVVALEPQAVCVRSLKCRFPMTERLVVIPMGVGAVAGTATLYESVEHVLSTLSLETVRNPLNASPFAASYDVGITTLDALIAVFGMPDFVKIDVEGYEPEVLRGLHQAPRALSVEYNPSKLPQLVECLGLLDALGDYEFSFSAGESMVFATGWMSATEIVGTLPGNEFGDVYARLR
ncbi:MAG TPA: FkbM family methyltransferase [Sporichthyaceae bacterium]|jgi:FkbM family methyltransferase|nr:FkbM family methyltransferase [Sporichthyaceae bacterium]